ncbi:MAG: major capsid protein [Hyphomicrobiaceae bacterium]|nr:major capsid protein [Hyphomicrobiaceae bacterium]
METGIDELVRERFGTVDLSSAINKRDNEYGLLNSLGLFDEEGIDEHHVKIETRSQSISMVPTSEIGTPAPAGDTPDIRDVRILPTFRHAKMHRILAKDLQGVRMFGSNDTAEMVDIKMLEKIDLIQREHRQTKEFMRWGALKGNVYDPDGQRLLFNTYDLMDETQRVIEWDLNNANAVDPIQTGNDVLLDHMETEALGETINGVIKFCSPAYMTKMQENKEFRDAYKYFASQNGGEINPNRQSARRPFEFKDVTYIRHLGKASFKAKDGSPIVHTFIPDGEAIAVPLGTFGVFQTYFGPLENTDGINTIGQEVYVLPKVMDLNMGVELHSYSYQLNMVKKPRLVVRCKVKP